MGLIFAIFVVFEGALCRTRQTSNFIDLEYSVLYTLCLYRQDVAEGRLIGQLGHLRIQWSVGRGALEPLRRLVFWCGPR